MTAAISSSVWPGCNDAVTRSKISSVSDTAARIRRTSSGDFRPRRAFTIASEETRRSAYGVPASVSCKQEPEPVGEPVGRRVRGRVVERDRARVEPLDRLEQVGGEALVVGDDLAVGA